MNQIGVSIVGAGFGERALLPTCLASPQIRVESIVAPNSTPKSMPTGVKLHRSLDLALADERTALVLVASPNGYHEAHVLAALKAGKHVLCEKPLALSWSAARSAHALCAERGLHGMVDFSFRYIPSRWYFSDLVRQGVIGELRYAHLQFFRDDLARWNRTWYFDPEVGGALRLTGPHLIDAALQLFGRMPTSVSATLERSGDIDVGFVLCLDFGDGATCIISVSHRVPGNGKHLIEAHGRAGSLYLTGTNTLVRVVETAEETLNVPVTYYSGFGGMHWEGNPRHQPTAKVLDLLVNAIHGLATEDAPTFQAGAANQMIVDASFNSALSCRRILLDEARDTIERRGSIESLSYRSS